jgi:hypothetical protein
VSRINLDAINSENFSHLLDDVCPHSLYTVHLLQSVRVIGLYPGHINNVLVRVESFEVNTLYDQHRLFTFLFGFNKSAFLNTLNTLNNTLLHSLFCNSEDQDLLDIQTETNQSLGFVLLFTELNLDVIFESTLDFCCFKVIHRHIFIISL